MFAASLFFITPWAYEAAPLLGLRGQDTSE